MASVIGGGPRKPPRIMARKNIVLKRVHRAPGVRDDEGAKLKREGFEVQSGVLTVNMNHPSNFKKKQLPGIADEHESYPCRFCDEKLFLTGAGLEKHARESHPQNLEDIMTDINTISSEWKKREFERLRARERHTMDRLRHEARAHQAVRAALAGGNPAPGGDQYEACGMCSMLVNIAHPTAMESHQRAHKKNDELRLQLIDQYGDATVKRLTCEACSLVFPDNQKLASHVHSHHTRRKKYICKYCGHISQSMSELNLHKSDVHNYSAWSNVPEFLKSRRSVFQYDDDLKRMRRRTAEEMAEEVAVRQPILGQISEGDTAGRVTCPDCGLKLNRPRLLFKHMERVHLKSSFTCMVESGGLPTFGIEVQNSEITWLCCESRFDNRAEFVEHRRLHIPTQELTEPSEEVVHHEMPLQMPTDGMVSITDGGVNEDGEPTTQNIPAHFIHNPDGTVHVIVPEGVQITGDFYMFYDEYGKANKVSLIPQHPMMQEEDNQEMGMMIQEEADGQMMMDADEEAAEDEDQGYPYQMHLDNEWDNMEVIMVNEEDVIEEEVEHDVPLHMMDEEGVDDEDEGVVRINGQPLFD